MTRKEEQCPKCHDTKWYQYDDNHSKICEVCCKHDRGVWRLMPKEYYGKKGGWYSCVIGCGEAWKTPEGRPVYTSEELRAKQEPTPPQPEEEWKKIGYCLDHGNRPDLFPKCRACQEAKRLKEISDSLPDNPFSGDIANLDLPKEEPQGKTHKVEIASFDTVVIDKLFGPTIFMNLRITASIERGWVIERETQNKEGLLQYVEWTTIPAQLDIDFPKEDATTPQEQPEEGHSHVNPECRCHKDGFKEHGEIPMTQSKEQWMEEFDERFENLYERPFPEYGNESVLREVKSFITTQLEAARREEVREFARYLIAHPKMELNQAVSIEGLANKYLASLTNHN